MNKGPVYLIKISDVSYIGGLSPIGPIISLRTQAKRFHKDRCNSLIKALKLIDNILYKNISIERL
jgi:hypothetical protein